jgi:nitrogen-specific signal transduction histidine kinase
MEEQQKGLSDDNLRTLKHDIKNQLSNIYLALEQLKYEIPDPSADCLFYLDTIATSSTRINTILNSTD